MTFCLEQLRPCFEGLAPALIATSSVDGMPNVSYLSHVSLVDDQHIALSNQFFSKTSENLRSHSGGSVLVVDVISGIQYTLEVELHQTLTCGQHFDRMAARILGSSARVGMADVMRLRSVDIFHVLAISAAPFMGAVKPHEEIGVKPSLIAVDNVTEEMALRTDVGGLIDATLSGLEYEFGMKHTLFMVMEEGSGQLSAIGSRGYVQSGIGSDVALGEGAIGAAALTNQPVRINDLSRTARYSAAVASCGNDENASRRISLPGILDPLSQIAVPISVNGVMYGVLFAESKTRLAFSSDHETALTLIARQAGTGLALIDKLAMDEIPPALIQSSRQESMVTIQVIYYAYDDSIFIDGSYVIKGIAGRLLRYMLMKCLELGRREFSNREIRLDTQLRLPTIKDNLETRLLLLRRRLEERDFPIRIERIGRGRISLLFDGEINLVLGGETPPKISSTGCV